MRPTRSLWLVGFNIPQADLLQEMTKFRSHGNCLLPSGRMQSDQLTIDQSTKTGSFRPCWASRKHGQGLAGKGFPIAFGHTAVMLNTVQPGNKSGWLKICPESHRAHSLRCHHPFIWLCSCTQAGLPVNTRAPWSQFSTQQPGRFTSSITHSVPPFCSEL